MSKNIASTLGAVFLGATIAGAYVLFAPQASSVIKLTAGQTHRYCVYASFDVFRTVSKRQDLHKTHGEPFSGCAIQWQCLIPKRCSRFGQCLPKATAVLRFQLNTGNRLLDMLHTIMVIASSWIWLIANFGNTDTDQIPP